MSLGLNMCASVYFVEVDRMNCAKGKTLFATAIVLLFCTLVLGVTEGQNQQPNVSFTTVPAPPKAYQQFDINLIVEINPQIIFPQVYGSFSVLDRSRSNETVYGPEFWMLETWTSTGAKSWTFAGLSLPPGDYFLWTDVWWSYQGDGLNTIYSDMLITVEPSAPPGELYSIEWLKPTSFDKPFHAGRTIKIGFSVFDSDGNFKRDESVNVTVTDGSGTKVFTAVYGEGENPVRIKESTERYVVYWKTEKGMSGEYTITVTFANAQVTTPPETVTIRP